MFSKKQKGLSPIGILFVVCVFAFALIVALKLATHYIDYNSIRSAFKDQAQMPGVKDMQPGTIMDNIDKQLRINSVRGFDLKQNAYVGNEDGIMVIGFDYEVREHMFANIDVVLSFKFEQPVE